MFSQSDCTLCAQHSLLFSLDSPPRGPADSEAAGCSTAPDSSTVCASSTYALHPDLKDKGDNYPSKKPYTSSGSLTQSSAAITSTFASHPPAPLSPAQSPLSRSKPSSPSSSCPTFAESPSPTTAPTQTSSLGQRRKGLAHKVRRSQRQRGRQSWTLAPREGGRKSEEEEREEAGGEERMEEDVEQDEERMEEEPSEETAGQQQ